MLSTTQTGQGRTICFNSSFPSLFILHILWYLLPGFVDHFNAHPDPCFHFKADPDQNFHVHADPDPDHAPHDANLRPPLSTGPPVLHFEFPRLHCEPLELPNLDFIAYSCGFGSATLPNTIPICKLHHMWLLPNIESLGCFHGLLCSLHVANLKNQNNCHVPAVNKSEVYMYVVIDWLTRAIVKE